MGRKCRYQSDSVPREGDSRPPFTAKITAQPNGKPPLALSLSSELRTPSCHDSIQSSALEAVICQDAFEILGDYENVSAITTKYFDTLSHRVPFIWKERFNSRLRSTYDNPHADYSLLCLCIYLIIQYPPKYGKNVQSSLYARVKSHISLLEASSLLSLEFVQARLLVSLFEIGHGLYPAASISIGACARTARALGLHKKQFVSSVADDSSRQRAEEEKRVWWEIVNSDRYATSLVQLALGSKPIYVEDYIDHQADSLICSPEMHFSQLMILPLKTNCRFLTLSGQKM